MECGNQSDKSGVKFSVCEMRASAHPGSCAVCVVRSARAFRVLKIAFDVEFFRFFEVGFVEVGSPCILRVILVMFYSPRECAYHVEGCSSGNYSLFVLDVFDTRAR
jgi:hypothetical protein